MYIFLSVFLFERTLSCEWYVFENEELRGYDDTKIQDTKIRRCHIYICWGSCVSKDVIESIFLFCNLLHVTEC
jgi:hypothetical protein